jgi:hypothetical protein
VGDETIIPWVPPGSGGHESVPSVQGIVGSWVSGVRATREGAMQFRFLLAADGHLEIRGRADATAVGYDYYRSGPYVLEGDQLIASVINEGRPARVRLLEGQLVLTIDETLEFQLRRE